MSEEDTRSEAQKSWDAALARAKRKEAITIELAAAGARRRHQEFRRRGWLKQCDRVNCEKTANVFKNERWLCEEHQHG